MGLSEENGLDRGLLGSKALMQDQSNLLPVLKTNALMSGTCLLHYSGVQWFGGIEGKGKTNLADKCCDSYLSGRPNELNTLVI